MSSGKKKKPTAPSRRAQAKVPLAYATPENRPRKSTAPLDLACVLILLAAVLVAFSPAFHAGFLTWDDMTWIARNPALNPPDSLATFWNKPFLDMYVPLTFTVWAFIASLNFTPNAPGGIGLDPAVFHAANVLFHCVNSILMYCLIRMLIRRPWAALLGAMLFAVHPLQVEAVAWASALKDVLCACLSLIALLCLLRAMKRAENESAGTSRIGWGWYAAATAAFIFAMLAKPSAVTLPLVGFVLIVFHLIRRAPQRDLQPRRWRTEARVSLPAILCMLPWLIFAGIVAAIGRHFQPGISAPETPVYFRPIVALDSLAFYAGKLLAPIHLTVDYGRSPDWLLASPQRFWTWIIPAAAIVLAWIFRRRLPALAACIAIVIACLLPVLGLVRFDFQDFSTVTDHYFYLAMIGPALLVAAIAARWLTPQRFPVSLALALLLGIILGGLTFHQTGYWQNDHTLFNHTLEINPTSDVAFHMLGLTDEAEGNFPQAAIDFHNCLHYHPDDLQTHQNFGNLLMRFKYYKEALVQYQLALGKHRGVELSAPDRASIYCNMAIAEVNLRSFDAAEKYFQAAIDLDPANETYHDYQHKLSAMKIPTTASPHSP